MIEVPAGINCVPLDSGVERAPVSGIDNPFLRGVHSSKGFRIVLPESRDLTPAATALGAEEERWPDATTEIASSHVPMLSHADLVIDLIRAAARAARGAWP
jgi:hypothetical protein